MSIHKVTEYGNAGVAPDQVRRQPPQHVAATGLNHVRDLAIKEALELINQGTKETYIVGQFVMRGMPLEDAQAFTKQALDIHYQAKNMGVAEHKAAPVTQDAVQAAFEKSLRDRPIPEDQIVSVGTERRLKQLDMSTVLPTDEFERLEVLNNMGVIHPSALLVKDAVEQAVAVPEQVPVQAQGQPVQPVNALSDLPSSQYPKLAFSAKHFMVDEILMHVSLEMKKPNIVVIEDFVTDEEVRQILTENKPHLRRSTVHRHEDGASEESDYRTSSSASLARTDLLKRLEERIGRVFMWPTTRMENFEMVNYTKEQEYKQHCDYFSTESVGGKQAIAQWNGNRVATAIVYLEKADDGGGTGFPLIGLDLNPKVGSLVFFSYPVDWEHKNLTTHAGLPVLQGEKTILTKWMRAQTAV